MTQDRRPDRQVAGDPQEDDRRPTRVILVTGDNPGLIAEALRRMADAGIVCDQATGIDPVDVSLEKLDACPDLRLNRVYAQADNQRSYVMPWKQGKNRSSHKRHEGKRRKKRR